MKKLQKIFRKLTSVLMGIILVYASILVFCWIYTMLAMTATSIALFFK